MTTIAKTTTRNYSKTELFDGYDADVGHASAGQSTAPPKTTKPITLATTPPPALGANAHATTPKRQVSCDKAYRNRH